LGLGVPMLFDADDGTSSTNDGANRSTGDAPSESGTADASIDDAPWLLTVAQDGSAQFKSINEALEQASPGMTVAILDSAEYEESLLLNLPSRHNGLSLVAARGATLVNDRPSPPRPSRSYSRTLKTSQFPGSGFRPRSIRRRPTSPW
jgi:hypothetical protein